MIVTQVDSLNRTVQKTHEWLVELSKEEGLAGEEQAYSALRGVLQALRDRLTVDEAAHLGAQLPMMVRGIYFEGWRPSDSPSRERTKEAFLESVLHKMHRDDIDPEKACRGTFSLLSRKVTAGEIEDVRHMLPEPVRDLWS